MMESPRAKHQLRLHDQHALKSHMKISDMSCQRVVSLLTQGASKPLWARSAEQQERQPGTLLRGVDHCGDDAEMEQLSKANPATPICNSALLPALHAHAPPQAASSARRAACLLIALLTTLQQLRLASLQCG